MQVKKKEWFELVHPGDYYVEDKKLKLICPSCHSLSSSPAYISSEEPLNLFDTFCCNHCFADYSISNGEITPTAGTLPPFSMWEQDAVKFR